MPLFAALTAPLVMLTLPTVVVITSITAIVVLPDGRATSSLAPPIVLLVNIQSTKANLYVLALRLIYPDIQGAK